MGESNNGSSHKITLLRYLDSKFMMYCDANFVLKQFIFCVLVVGRSRIHMPEVGGYPESDCA